MYISEGHLLKRLKYLQYPADTKFRHIRENSVCTGDVKMHLLRLFFPLP